MQLYGKWVNILPLLFSVISSYFDCKLVFAEILLFRIDAGMLRGLRLILLIIAIKENKTEDQCHRRAFKQLFGIL